MTLGGWTREGTPNHFGLQTPPVRKAMVPLLGEGYNHTKSMYFPRVTRPYGLSMNPLVPHPQVKKNDS